MNKLEKIRAYDPLRDKNTVVIDLYIKTVKPLKHIKLNTVVTKTGISFEKKL